MKKNIFYILFIILIPSCDYCKTAEKIAKSEVIGIVDSKKKLDWNRGEQTIMYKNAENQIKYYEILMDESGLWDFVEKGDSLYKPLNNKTMKVYRNGELAGNFLLDIGCIKHLKNEK
jgi:glutaredoxin